MTTHAFCWISLLIASLQLNKKLDTLLTILPILLTVVNWSHVCNYLFRNRPVGEAMTVGYTEFLIWLQVECMIFPACIFAPIVFMFCRAWGEHAW